MKQKEIILSKQEIEAVLTRIADGLNEELKDEPKTPVFICVMRGAMPFYSDLVKRINRNIMCDYVQLSSYEGGTSTTGKVRLSHDVSINIKDRVVVVVDDVVDSGLSMSFLTKHLRENYSPKRIIVCALMDKPTARLTPMKVDYCGKEMAEPKFLVGYGLDYKQMLRNVPYVYVATPEEIAEIDKIEP